MWPSLDKSRASDVAASITCAGIFRALALPTRASYARNRLTRRAARGPGLAGSEAANTDRRAQGNKRRPSGQGPGARLLDGLASQGKVGVTGSPRPSSQPRPSRKARSPRRAPPAAPRPGREPRHRAAATQASRQPAAPRQILRAPRPPAPARRLLVMASTRVARAAAQLHEAALEVARV